GAAYGRELAERSLPTDRAGELSGFDDLRQQRRGDGPLECSRGRAGEQGEIDQSHAPPASSERKQRTDDGHDDLSEQSGAAAIVVVGYMAGGEGEQQDGDDLDESDVAEHER